MRKDEANPMHPDGKGWRLALAADHALCGTSHSKRAGVPCRARVVVGWRVCRMQGAGGGYSVGASHPRWVHGLHSREWTDTSKTGNELLRRRGEIGALIG